MHRPSAAVGDFQLLDGYESAPCAETDLDAASGDWDLGDEALRPGQAYSARARREAEANQFAAELLLPANLVRTAYIETRSNGASVRTLARRFAVSEDVALRRLISLLSLGFEDAETSHFATDEQEARGVADLSAEQREAAEAPTPALVIAGPGTGKTSTLVGRIAWLIHEQHVEPERILALTFSNKAAREMRNRVGQFLSTVAETSDHNGETNEVETLRQITRAPAISTIHAYCGELLRRYGHLVGLRPDFLLIGPTDGYFLLRSLVEQLPLTTTSR